MANLLWFFDPISPFAYLQWKKMDTLKDSQVECIPILFAGLLKHWGHKGPAEIPCKRIFTYRHVKWLAQREKVKMNIPPEHPFNPLPALRLIVALENKKEVIDAVFDFIWAEGKSIHDVAHWEELLGSLSVNNSSILKEDRVKEQLKANGERAIQLGVFGVPTFIYREQVFWGFDSMDMLKDYIKTPEMFDADKEIIDLPEKHRKL